MHMQRIRIERLEKLAVRLSEKTGVRYTIAGCSGNWILQCEGVPVFRGNGEAMHLQMLVWLGVDVHPMRR